MIWATRRQAKFLKTQLSTKQKKSVVQFKKKEEYPHYKHAYKLLPIESKILFREWDDLQVHEDTVYHQKQQQPRRLISPSKLEPLVYNELHVNMDHPGTDRTTELIKSRFYRPLMDDEIKHFVTQVFPCVEKTSPHNESSSNTEYINI